MRRAAGALLRKDLRAELRTFESLPAMALFGITTLVVFHFALDRESVEGDLASGVLWVTLLFAAMLGVNRLFVAERDQGGFEGFLLAPVDRTALLIAKAALLLGYLVAVELVLVPAFAILLLGPSPWQALPELLAVLALADVGIAIAGTLVAALSIQTRARDLIGPIIALPLLVPLLIAAAQGTAPLLAEAGSEGLPGKWPAVLGLYDMVIGLVAYGVFDFLVED